MNLYRHILNGTVLTVPPRNWDAIRPQFARDDEYVGFFFEFPETNVTFVKDGKNIIDQAWEADKTKAVTTYIIEELDQATQTYSNFYTGFIDYLDYDSNEIEVTVGIKNQSIVSKFKERDDKDINAQSLTDFDGGSITAFTDETIEITLTNQILKKFLENRANDNAFAYAYSNSGLATRQNIYYLQLTPQTDTVDGKLDIVNFDLPTAYSLSQPGPNFEAKEPGDLRIEWRGGYRIGGTEPLGYTSDNFPNGDLIVRKNEDAEIVINSTEFAASGTIDVKNVDATAFSSYTFSSLLPGDKISIYFKWDVTGSNPPQPSFARQQTTGVAPPVNTGEPFGYRLVQLTEYQDTPCKIMPIWEFLVRLFQVATGLADPLRSSFFGRTDGELFTYAQDGPGSLVGVTNGALIRQLDITDRPIVTDIKTAFRDFKARFNVAVGFENGKIIIEHRDYFYDNSTSLFALNDVPNIRTSNANEWLFNELLLGDTKFETEQQGNLTSPAPEKSYSVDCEVKGKYDIRSQFITSSPVIENVRRDNESDKDNRYDNAVFLIKLVRDGGSFRPEKGSDLISVSNTTVEREDTYFNLSLSPNQSFVKHHQSWASVPVYTQTSLPEVPFRFVNGKGNTLWLITDADGVFTNEADNYLAVDPIIQPVAYKFEYPITKDQLEILKNNPKGYITVTGNNGQTFKGFIDNASPQIKGRKTSFRILKLNET